MYFIKTYFTCLFLLFTSVVILSCSSKITFNSLHAPDGINHLPLTGYLFRPESSGRFPAIVMLHHCSGLDQQGFFSWARELTKYGYVTFLIDSFGPRGITSVCKAGDSDMSSGVRAYDAHAAKLYLARLSFVDPERIAVMGWSHGASGAIWSLLDPSQTFPGRPFRAAVAYYPFCRDLINLNAPLLILIGAEDDWTSALRCKDLLVDDTPHEVILKIYPNTHHSFFFPVESQIYLGHRIEYNYSAMRDAKERTIQFLHKHMKANNW